jgi:hypothetical protein
MAAFERGLPGEWGRYIVLLTVLLFGISTAIAWSYYGDRCAFYLFGPKAVLPYKIVFVGMHFVGAVVPLAVAWTLGDVFLGLVIIPNLIALVFLTPEGHRALEAPTSSASPGSRTPKSTSASWKRSAARRGSDPRAPTRSTTSQRNSGMMRTFSIAFAAGLLVLSPVLAPQSAVAQDLPRTGAERANWERASRHQEVLDFLAEIQRRSDKILVEELTVTNEGRSHVVAYLGDPPHSDPGAALLSGKPTVFIVSSIHGGERSGREGGQQMIRELTLGDHQHLLEHVNVIIVPNMNPDGGDAGNNGRRTNSLGYDMNRDWVVWRPPR